MTRRYREFEPEHIESTKKELLSQASPGLSELFEEAAAKLPNSEESASLLRTFILAAYFRGYRDGVIIAKTSKNSGTNNSN